MIIFDEAIVNNIIYHKIGTDENALFLNTETYDLSKEEEEQALIKIFLKPFSTSVITYEFKHQIDINLNPLFKISREIYNNENFTLRTQDIAKHLKAVSKHPNIKSGELFMLEYDNVKLDNNYYKALGIYKIENKDFFLETDSSLNFKKGIGNKKLDKACLILFSEEPYTLFVIDNTSNETDYWLNDFINLKLRNDYVNSTNNIITLTKNFISNQIKEEYEINKVNQIDLLNKTANYFKTHETFEKKEFEKEIFQEESLIESFRNFDREQSKINQIEVNDNFAISTQTIKKQLKIFKSILKLDKNFHVYIHGNTDLIEQGVEKDGRKYYKIYYQEES